MSVPRYWRNEVPRYRLQGEECSACGAKYFPSRPVCNCGSTEFKTYKLSEKGKVVTWTTIRNSPIGFEKYVPYIVAMIELEDGNRLLSQIVDISAEDITAAILYTAAPVYMDSGLTSESLYYLKHIKCNFEGAGDVNMTPDIVNWNIQIVNEFVPRKSNTADEDNYGNSMNNYAGAFYLKSRRYAITLNVLPSDNTIKFMTAMQAQDTDNALNIEFHRNNGAEVDNIVFDFDNNPAICRISDIDAMAQFALANDNTWTIILEPKALVNAVVTDDVEDYEIVPT